MCTLPNVSTVHDVLTNDGPTEKATALDYREMVEETPLYTLRKMVLRQFLCASPSLPLSNTSLTLLSPLAAQRVPALPDVSLLTRCSHPRPGGEEREHAENQVV